MIFVTVGTHEQPFNRLLEAVDALAAAGILTEEVILQTGYSTYIPKNCIWKPFFPYSEMLQLVRQARIVITPGGPSSFLMAIRNDKVPIVVPRTASFGEHINDHQVRFCEAVLSESPSFLLVKNIADLADTLKNYDVLCTQCSAKALNHNAAFNEGIQRIVEELLP